MNKKVTQILESLSIKKWNKVQEETYESCAQNDNNTILAPTGSGKTLAFLLPILTSEKTTLIITPTRELALQIYSVVKDSKSQIPTTVCYGGHSLTREANSLKTNPKIVIGTPGRILDHIDKKTITINLFEHLILDEYDKCLEMGFEDQIGNIYNHLEPSSITLASATILEYIPDYMSKKDFKELNFLNDHKPKIKYFKVLSSPEEKMEKTTDLVLSLQGQTTIVFCNHREATDRLEEMFWENGIQTSKFHGGLEQIERERAIIKFQNKTCNVLVCTDLAARGIDIADVENVIHYQLPNDQAQFVHRNGRTARQGKDGQAYLILKRTDKIEKLTNEKINEIKLKDQRQKAHSTNWTTLFIGAGKKDKISKGDIVGFLIKQGNLEMQEIGHIDIKDVFCYVAVPSEKAKDVLRLTQGLRVKKKKPKIAISR